MGKNMNNLYYQFVLVLILLINVGCSSSLTESFYSASDCSMKPNTVLHPEQIKPLTLTDKLIEISGVAIQDAIGYQFFAQAGQTIQYKTDQELCIWLYTPDNQILEETTLPLSGNYILQIVTKGQSKEFKLSLGLDVKSISKESPEISSSTLFSQQDFPKDRCGDDMPTDSNITSVQFYPVNISYSPENLDFIRANFCRDAYQKRDKSTREKLIQISSFTDQNKAQEFANFVESKVSGVTVGLPTTIYLNDAE